MRKKKCLRTPSAGAGPSPKATHQTVAVGWDFAGSAAAKTASIPARGTRISTVKASGSMTAKSKTAKGSPSPAPADEPPVALFSLAEIVDKPIEWVVEGVIPRGELTLITGEAGVGKSGFLAGLIANVTRGRLGPRDVLCPADSERPEGSGLSDDLARSKPGTDSDTKPFANRARTSPDGPGGAPRGSDVARDNGHAHHMPAHSAETRHSSSATTPAPAAVVIFSTANMLADAVRPRLIEAGADLGKVYALCQLEKGQLEEGQLEGISSPAGGRPGGGQDAGGSGEIAADSDSVAGRPSLRPQMFQWHRDLPVLEAELARLRASGIQVSMMVIDAVDGFVAAPRRRSLVAAEVEKLAELARKFRVGIVLAANVSPAAMLRTNRPRGMAGIDTLSKVARTVWMIVRDPDVANGRMLVPIKKNCSMTENGFAYLLDQGKIAWDEAPVGIQDADLFREVIVNPQDPLARERQFESDRAANWLQERLGSGKVAAFEVQAEAAENEITEASLRRAFRRLGCKTNKEQAKGEKVRWYWRLPDEGCLSRHASPRLMTRPLPETENRSPSGIPQGKELLVS
ncbi:MAG: hypothetical protein DWI02_03285 [Planctomycetota bacterium]|nr:MAG: hypothetical protein DWI02_03285 [Planctomycetota bacterium]